MSLLLAVASGKLEVEAKGTGNARGIYNRSWGSVTISGGEVIVSTKSGSAVGYNNYEYGSSEYTGGKLEVKSESGEVNGLNLGEHTITIRDGFVLDAHSHSGSVTGIAHDGGYGSTLNMYGGSVTATSDTNYSCGVRVMNPNIYGGEIYGGKYGIETSDSGNPYEGVVIGTKGGELNVTSPKIRGGEYAVYGDNIYFYDGVLYGGIAA